MDTVIKDDDLANVIHQFRTNVNAMIAVCEAAQKWHENDTPHDRLVLHLAVKTWMSNKRTEDGESQKKPTNKAPRPITPAEKRVIQAAADLYSAWDAVNCAWDTNEYNQAVKKRELREYRFARSVRTLEREKAKVKKEKP